MSTYVIVSAPKPGHWPVRVTEQYFDTISKEWREAATPPEVVEKGGASRVYTIHQTNRLLVEEITGA